VNLYHLDQRALAFTVVRKNITLIQARMYDLSQGDIKDVRHVSGADGAKVWVVKLLHRTLSWFCLLMVC
jgi:hypothetical protein